MNQEIITQQAMSACDEVTFWTHLEVKRPGGCEKFQTRLGAKQLGEMESDVVYASCKLVDVNDYKLRGIEPYLGLMIREDTVEQQ